MSRKDLYKSKAWQDTRRYIWLKQSCLCARCNKPVYVDGISEWIPKEKRLKGIVHHKIYLNDYNYTNDNIAFAEENLEGLCIECHNEEHFNKGVTRMDVKFDEFGNLVKR